MEVIIHSPSFYLHIQDALILIEYCINGLLEFVAQIEI